MKRGDLVTIAMQGDFGKPRPALVIQADAFGDLLSLTLLPVSSSLLDAPRLRVPLQPNAANGLQKPSQVVVDKAMTLKRERVGPAFGRIDPDTLIEVERCLAIFLGIAK